MHKKLITACMALVALAAFALPATASAVNDPDITHPTNTLLGTPTKIKATNVGVTKMLSPGGSVLVECSVATMTGTLTKNDGAGNVEGTIENTTFAGTGTLREGEKECTGSFGNVTVHTNIGNGTPWCLRSTSTMATDKFQVRGGSCSEEARSITFVLTSTTVGTCKYNRTTAIEGEYTTHPEDAVLHLKPSTLTEFTKEEGGFFCPGAGQLEMSFTLETDTTPTADPLYIS
jgi:hypothetical protein